MKKIILMAVSAVLLAAGCQKTTIENPAPEPTMVFKSGLTKLTKAQGTADAAGAGMTNLQAQDFRVWAYANYTDAVNDVTPGKVYDKMENLNVYYNVVSDEGNTTSTGSWSTKKEYYWPGTDKNLMFFAVSGANYGDDLSNQNVVVPDFTEKSIKVSEFNVAPATPNTDLMVADVVDQHQGDKEVNLTFHHALSKVEFLFKTVPSDKMRVLVQSIEVEGLVSKASLSVTAAATGTSYDKNNTIKTESEPSTDEEVTSTVYPVSFIWTPATNQTEGDTPTTATFVDDYKNDYDFTKKWGEGENATTNIELATGKIVDPAATEGEYYDPDFDKTAMTLTSDATIFATWLMIPQDITNKTVKVTYIINSRQFEAIFKLDHDSLKGTEENAVAKWGYNKYVRYTVTLSPNVISFSPSVEDWDQHDTNASTTELDDITMQN